ncbi:DUF4440 domain-containing protein [Bacillus sp. ISL-39]|uniref:nuclear transport factor 2 family protein n=1 Tax=Bacillus sp. ISL-39 TaxID=2819124 RepID=UPI001BE63BA3|nr:DUF4440 domain-containing protein [Bacillus sp. ISL-39]MBT2640390.1 DUF4440 domain-containing protein [Bacillus sp. ISL-39]
MDLKEHIKHLEEKLLTSEVRSSKTELKRLLADEFFEFGSSGRVLHKDENFKDGGIGMIKATISNFDIHTLSENIVLATYRTFNEQTKQHALRSSIWKLNEGIWKMVFHQGTKTDPSF